MHGESPAVQRLSIHLSNEHYVNFHAHQTVNKVLARQNVKKTQLTAWFDYNSAYGDGLDLTYWQFPQHYTWNAKVKSWHPRQQAKYLLYLRKHVWQEDYWRMIMSGGFAWRKQLQCSLEWHVIGYWQLSC